MSRSLLVLVLLAALLGGGLSHSLVPHQHSHSHTEGETTIWTTLHSSLRHEDKKLLVSLVEGAVLLVVASVISTLAILVSRRVRTVRADLLDMRERDALRKGIFRYRAFG